MKEPVLFEFRQSNFRIDPGLVYAGTQLRVLERRGVPHSGVHAVNCGCVRSRQPFVLCQQTVAFCAVHTASTYRDQITAGKTECGAANVADYDSAEAGVRGVLFLSPM